MEKTNTELKADSKASLTAAPGNTPAPAGEPAKASGVDVELFARNLARMIEEGGKAIAAYMKPREQGKLKDEMSEDVTEVVKTVGQVAEYWLSDPKRSFELQTSLGRAYLDLWASTVKRMAGEPAEPAVKADPRDKRFADPEWSQNQFFDFLKQAYLLTTHWGEKLVKDADGVDEHTRQKAEFYVRQIANAISPSNFVLTNPELLRETMSSNAENLVRGMHMLSEDIEAGHGNLKIRQSDPGNFAVGRNLALTPGKVIFQNDLMQLIQYEATTKDVLKVPLLIVDGKTLSENVAIQQWIDMTFPDANLLPKDPWQRLQAVSVMAWCASGIHPYLSRINSPLAVCDVPGSEDSVKRHAAEHLFETYGIADDMLAGRDYFFDHFTAADAHFFWCFRRGTLFNLDLSQFGNCMAHFERMKLRPSVQKLLAFEKSVQAEFAKAA